MGLGMGLLWRDPKCLATPWINDMTGGVKM